VKSLYDYDLSCLICIEIIVDHNKWIVLILNW